MTTTISSSRTIAEAPILNPSQPPASAGNGLSVQRDLQIVDLTVTYHRGSIAVTPVEGFSLYASANRVTALVGRSGSGKTSILSCIAATLRPASGAVWLGGIEVSALNGSNLDRYRRSQVGVVHQAYNLIQSLTALENVAVPLMLVGVKRKEADERAAALLKQFGMGAYGRQRPGQLSGGQQQRVAVARALANDPEVIVADEPTAHLDGSSVGEVMEILRSVAESGRTVILSTHDDRLLKGCDQVLVLK
jgi:putative ABC transport system ATP-binding protein